MDSIVLVGMPGAGKTTVGKLLATSLNIDFIDTDWKLEQSLGCSLQDFLNRHGAEQFLQREEAVLMSLKVTSRSVISTGGSAIYSHRGMANLQVLGTIVYLRVSIDTVMHRVDNWADRGFISSGGQDLRSVYNQRCPLYEDVADIVVGADAMPPSQVCQAVQALLQSRQPNQ